MSESLSVILPVCQAEQALSGQVERLLEICADFETPFDITVVDDCSTDETIEIAEDLARRYPQVRVIRQGRRSGVLAAARTGIQQTNGSILLIHDIKSPVSSRTIRSFWAMRTQRDGMMVGLDLNEASAPSGPNPRIGVAAHGTRMLRREAVGDLQSSESAGLSSHIRVDRAGREANANRDSRSSAEAVPAAKTNATSGSGPIGFGPPDWP